jgi:phosphoglycerate dehydrogenase-like enzyme
MKPLLLILDDWEGLIQKSCCWDQFADRLNIKFLKQPIEQTSDFEIEQVEFLMTVRERTVLSDQLFGRMPMLKLVLQTGAHAYHIDLAAAQRRNIMIALGEHVKAPLFSVPELVFAFALGLMHKLNEADHAMHNGDWPLLTGRTLSDRRLGILGLGRHGLRAAQIARMAFNMEVVAWERIENSFQSAHGIKRMPLDELLKSSDIVSIHLRLSKESTGLINKERLAKMKSGALLINTSRGAIVDENALIEALKNGRLAGAGLDVFTHEPLPKDSPLRKLNNVILSPHIGWTVEEVLEEFAKIASAQLMAYLNGALASSEPLRSETRAFFST